MSPTPRALGVLLIVAAAAGALVLTTGTTEVATATTEVATATFDDAAFRSVTVMSELAEDKPQRLAISGSLADLKPGRQKLFFANQAMYHGVLNDTVVREVIARGRADTLEHRLRADAQERLRALLADFDQALRDVSLVISDEEDRVKRELLGRPDRIVRIMTMPREQDQAFLELRAAHAQVSNGRGAVWGFPSPSGDSTEVHVVKWEEWPGLRAMEARCSQERAPVARVRDDRTYSLEGEFRCCSLQRGPRAHDS